MDCEDIEAVPGKMAERPAIKGTRIEPDVIFVYEDHGMSAEETHADYPTVPIATIERLRAFAISHNFQLRP